MLDGKITFSFFSLAIKSNFVRGTYKILRGYRINLSFEIDKGYFASLYPLQISRWRMNPLKFAKKLWQRIIKLPPRLNQKLCHNSQNKCGAIS
jgi:hypothetical protein